MLYRAIEQEFEDRQLEIEGLGAHEWLLPKTPKKIAPLKDNFNVSAAGKRKTSLANVSTFSH